MLRHLRKQLHGAEEVEKVGRWNRVLGTAVRIDDDGLDYEYEVVGSILILFVPHDAGERTFGLSLEFLGYPNLLRR